MAPLPRPRVLRAGHPDVDPPGVEPGTPGLTALEIAAGVVLGPAGDAVPDAAPTGPFSAALTPLAALEAAVLPALRRPPCLVSFSGGLDSSLVLAVAARVARRDGLAEPIPVTWRFTHAPRADESGWQERVVEALNSRTWQILRADDDLDLVGPVAQRMLLRHGLCHPANLHLHLPIVELAAGGSVLTGVGGDQVLAGWRRPGRSPVRWLARQTRAALRPGRAAADPFPWLHPQLSDAVRRAGRRERQREPPRLDHRIAWHTRRRDLVLTCADLGRLGAANTAMIVHPLLDAAFLAALIARAGHRRLARRDELLALIADGMLPAAVTAARPKARFLEVFLRAPTRRFAASWDGAGADAELVDVAALRTAWSSWPIPPGTATLVQHTWLAGSRAGAVASPTGAGAEPATDPDGGQAAPGC